jgi:DNA-nicking Smr family endonuclease
MKFETGDKVVVKLTNEDGEVTEIINDKMVMVKVRGVEFPTYVEQLDFPYFKMFYKEPVKLATTGSNYADVMAEKLSNGDPLVGRPKKYIDDLRKEKPTPKYRVTEGVWLLFFPVFNKDVFNDDVVEELKIYLVNQTDHALKFTFKLNYKGITDFEITNTIAAIGDFYIMNIDFEKLNDYPSFDFEFSLAKEAKNKADYYEASYKPKAKQLFQKINELLVKGDAFFNTQLFMKFPDKKPEPVKEDTFDMSKLGNAGFKIYDAKKIKQNLPPAQSVIDLHIEKLSNNPQQLNNAQMLDLQLLTFEKYYELAIAHGLPEFTVIHGIGEGVLKNEIHERLRLKKQVSSFVNQYHPWYGYGATEIKLKG